MGSRCPFALRYEVALGFAQLSLLIHKTCEMLNSVQNRLNFQLHCWPLVSSASGSGAEALIPLTVDDIKALETAGVKKEVIVAEASGGANY